MSDWEIRMLKRNQFWLYQHSGQWTHKGINCCSCLWVTNTVTYFQNSVKMTHSPESSDQPHESSYCYFALTGQNCLGITSFRRSDHSPFEFHMVTSRLVKCRKATLLERRKYYGFLTSRARFTVGSSCFMLFQWCKAAVNPTQLAWSHYNFCLLEKEVIGVSATNLGLKLWSVLRHVGGATACATLEKALCPSCWALPHVSGAEDLWERRSLFIAALQTAEKQRDLAVPLQQQQ